MIDLYYEILSTYVCGPNFGHIQSENNIGYSLVVKYSQKNPKPNFVFIRITLYFSIEYNTIIL